MCWAQGADSDRRGVGPEFADIAHVALAGPKLEAFVEITERNTAETRVNGEPPRVTVFPDGKRSWALQQELAYWPRRDFSKMYWDWRIS